jgi:trehalose 6-phosphate phosphatase
MIPDWTEQREELRSWLVSQPRVLIGCDFDGTLSPLVAHADDARLPSAVRAAMQRLVAQPGVAFAVISGRSIADLRQRVAVDGVWYAGNHGLEREAPDGSTVLAPGAEDAGPAMREVLAQLADVLAPIPGVWIEDKGLSASVHFRLAAEDSYDEVEARVRSVVQAAPLLKVRPAKRIWEILPAIEWDKGTALRWFMNRWDVPSRATAFMGDDVTDLDAFRELPDGWTFLVGYDLEADARVRLHDPGDTAALLEWMAKVRE